MTEQPRDWDRELADIDRVMAKQGAAPAGGAAPVPASPRASLPTGAPVRRRSVALTWFWVALALALGAALLIWPYQRACGLQLFFYLGAAGVTGLVALLAALASWSHRRGFAHVLSLSAMLWAGAVTLREVLPRVGYAKASRTWMCEAIPAAAGVPTGPTSPAQTQPAPRPQTPTQAAPGQPAPTQAAPAQPAPGQPAPAHP
jgi:hypothetical protein